MDSAGSQWGWSEDNGGGHEKAPGLLLLVGATLSAAVSVSDAKTKPNPKPLEIVTQTCWASSPVQPACA
jgi:hypothetical protein